MKNILLTLTFLMLWASAAGAQQLAEQTPLPEVKVTGGWYGITQTGNTTAGEYYFLDDSPAGGLIFEWDPLPHRFVLDSTFLNREDYFAEMDYSYRDVVVFNGYTRGLNHNLNHYSFGEDDPLTSSPTFTDLAPGQDYAIGNRLSRAFVRFKTPDFPLHLYADTRIINRDGTIQQRFLSMGGLNKVSEARDIEWNSEEYRVGLNSHLSWIEADYSHSEKRFEAAGQKVLYDDASGTAIAHNLVPDIVSSSDTVKLHTSYSGRLVLSGTYSAGDRENEDSRAETEFTNAAGDIMYMPVTSVILTVKYRHYDTDVTNPETVTITGLGTYNVRDSISSTRDMVTGVLRYRATNSLTFRGEYGTDTVDRTRGTINTVVAAPPASAPDFWYLPESTTRTMAKLGFTYRIMRKMSFRADYSQTEVDNPAYSTDPDEAASTRASLTWTPAAWFNTLLSYGILSETRDQLTAPLGGGKRDADREQALASMTVLLGSRTSATASYAYYRNDVEQTLTLQDGAGVFVLENAVPYADTSHTGSLYLTFVPLEGVNLTGGASRSHARGAFGLAGSGTVTNVAGIADLSQLKVVDTLYDAGLELELGKYASSEVRYQYRRYDDRIDDVQDGTVKLALATLSLRW